MTQFTASLNKLAALQQHATSELHAYERTKGADNLGNIIAIQAGIIAILIGLLRVVAGNKIGTDAAGKALQMSIQNENRQFRTQIQRIIAPRFFLPEVNDEVIVS